MIESWLDTNVILRYLLKDHPQQSPRSLSFIKGAGDRSERLKIAPFIVAEVIYVLEGNGYSRLDIYTSLRRLSRVPNITFIDEEVLFEALIDYRDKNVDFPDALLMAAARSRGETVWTFNKRDFKRLNGIWGEPGTDVE